MDGQKILFKQILLIIKRLILLLKEENPKLQGVKMPSVSSLWSIK